MKILSEKDFLQSWPAKVFFPNISKEKEFKDGNFAYMLVACDYYPEEPEEFRIYAKSYELEYAIKRYNKGFNKILDIIALDSFMEKLNKTAPEIIVKARNFAIEKHKGQFRKGSEVPYVAHLFNVAHILASHHQPIEAIVAGYLHDTLEDTNTTMEELETNFGSEIANLVKIETENKTLPYLKRKKEHMDRVKNGPYMAKVVNCADKLSNIRSLLYDEKMMDENHWNRFNAPKEVIGDYYNYAVESLEDLKDLEMYQKLKNTVNIVFDKNLQKKSDDKKPFEK